MDYNGFIGGSYTGQGIAVAAENCRNLFLEKLRGDGGVGHGASGYVMRQRPGLQLFAQSPDGSEPRYYFREPSVERVFAVCGRNLYELKIVGGIGYLGTVATMTLIGPVGIENPGNTALGRVTMATNALQLLICSAAQAFIFDFAANTLKPVDDAPFARAAGGAGAGSCTFIDGYFVVSSYDSRKFYYSKLLDGSTGNWDSLDVGSKEGASDSLISVVADHRQLMLFGSQSTEPWYDSGDLNNPLAPIPGTFIEQGLVASRGITKADNALFFIGQDKIGAGIIYRQQGYKAVRVSNHSIEWCIQQYPRLDDACFWSFQYAGHVFVVCCFPSGGEVVEPTAGAVTVRPGGWTWVYDCSTGFWYEWTHFKDGMETMFAGLHHTFAFNKHLVGGGDGTGNTYWMDQQFKHDNGDFIRRMRSGPVLNDEKKMLFAGTFELDAQVGVNSGREASVDVAPPTVPQTGVWLARPTTKTSYGGGDDAHPANGDEAVPGTTPGSGVIKMAWMYPLADWAKYPQILFGNLKDTPRHDLLTNVEWAEFRSKFSVTQSSTVPPENPPYLLDAYFQINFQPGLTLNQNGTISGFYGLYFDDMARSDYTLASDDTSDGYSSVRLSLGVHDNTGNTINPSLLSNFVRYKLSGSSIGGPFPEDPAIATIDDTAVALYYKAIRVNCGAAVNVDMYEVFDPHGRSGTFTYRADTAFTGGVAVELAAPPTNIYSSYRHGTSFRYDFGPGLFSDYYATTDYLVTLFFLDHISTGAGQNFTSVKINGVAQTFNVGGVPVTSFDVYSYAGGHDHGFSLDFPVTVTGKDPLVVEFTSATGEAMCCAVRVSPAANWDPELSATLPVVPAESPIADYVITMQVSRDGGFTWGNERTISLGKLGEYLTRLRWTRVGAARLPAIRIFWTAPVDVSIIAAYLDVKKGTS